MHLSVQRMLSCKHSPHATYMQCVSGGCHHTQLAQRVLAAAGGKPEAFLHGTEPLSGGVQVEGSIGELEGKLEGAREHGRMLARPCGLGLSLLSDSLLLKDCHAFGMCESRSGAACMVLCKCPMHGSHIAYQGPRKLFTSHLASCRASHLHFA